MNKYLEDPVLNLTAGALRVLRWMAMAFSATALVVAALIAVAALLPGMDLYDPASKFGSKVAAADLWSAFALILTGAGLMYLFTLFLKALRNLVLSVGRGQPLTKENAARLRLMGWISLAMQAAGVLMTALGMLGDAVIADFDFIYDFIEATLITALLFILARVFEHGARIQEELEGTV